MEESTGHHPKALTFIFLTVLIDVTGLGIIIPVLPQLIQQISHLGLSDASKLAGLMGSSFSLMLFFFAPIMGGLSDKYGRRPVLLLSLFGFGLDYVLQGFAPSITWLFIGRILAGITGSSFSTAASYIADVSHPDKKAQNFGLIGAAFGLGFIIGPAIGALLGNYGLRVPFFGAAILALCNLTFGFFVLPESLKPENRRPFEWKRANPFGTLKVLTQYPILRGFILTLFLVYVAHYSLQSTWSFYTMEKFHWDAKMIGISLSVVGIMAAIVQGGMTRILIPKLGNKKSILIGLVLAMTGYLAFSFAPAGWYMFAITVPFSFSGLAGPAIQGLVSNQVPRNAQGELQGGMTGLMGVTAIIGPLMMTNLFSYFTGKSAIIYFPGISFFVACILVLTGIIFVLKTLAQIES